MRCDRSVCFLAPEVGEYLYAHFARRKAAKLGALWLLGVFGSLLVLAIVTSRLLVLIAIGLVAITAIATLIYFLLATHWQAVCDRFIVATIVGWRAHKTG